MDGKIWYIQFNDVVKVAIAEIWKVNNFDNRKGGYIVMCAQYPKSGFA